MAAPEDPDRQDGTQLGCPADSSNPATDSSRVHPLNRSAGAEPLPYEETTSEVYAAETVCFEVDQPGGGIVLLRGQCPRCGHFMEFPIVTRVVKRRLPLLQRDLSVQSALTGDTVEPMICTCELDHPGRPPEDTGCGAYWNVRITKEDT